LELVKSVTGPVEAGAGERRVVAGAAVPAVVGVVVVRGVRIASRGIWVVVAVLPVPRVRRVVVPLLLPAALEGLRAGDCRDHGCGQLAGLLLRRSRRVAAHRVAPRAARTRA